MSQLADNESNRVFLRRKVVSLAHVHRSVSPLMPAAQPVLDRLGARRMASCSPAVLDEDYIVFLVRSVSSDILEPVFDTGRSVPACYSAIGQAAPAVAAA